MNPDELCWNKRPEAWQGLVTPWERVTRFLNFLRLALYLGSVVNAMDLT